jgi:ribosomal protein S18 acetylase RimI-like enzyme
VITVARTTPAETRVRGVPGMSVTFRTAAADDFPAIWQLYADVCEQAPRDAYQVPWALDVYPDERDIRGHLDAGEYVVGEADGRIVCAMALTPHDDHDFAGVPWRVHAASDEVSVIHLLCVHPSARGQGLGAALTNEAIRRSRQLGKKALRLDVVHDNLVASRVYRGCGFDFVGSTEAFYEDSGHIVFDMYELAL